MRVQVTASLSVDKTNRGTVAEEAGISVLVVVGVTAIGIEEPVVVGILVMVAGYLLLGGAFRVRLNVGVQETAMLS